MKIALFYPMNVMASWYALGGYSAALERLGHTVLDCPFPGNQVAGVELLRQVMPSMDDLAGCDVVLSMFHEYTQPWLAALYGEEAWLALMEKVPVVGRFDESMDRADLNLPHRVPDLLRWCTLSSFPAKQDAIRWAGQWLPFGADVEMFKPVDEEGAASPKMYELAFVGSLYPMRLKYGQALQRELPQGLFLRTGQVIVSDLGGPLKLASTSLLAENYRRVKVFFCLPPMSRLLVCKVFEVLACGSFLMYPELPGDAAGNMSCFEDGKHLVYYKGGHVKKNVKQILQYLEHEDEREAIAARGCQLVREKYTLDSMLQQLLMLAQNPFHDRYMEVGAT